MKKLVLLILSLMLGGMFVKAQTISYQPLHGHYTQYGYLHQHWNGTENVESFSKTIWSGDTTINGEDYIRIFQNGVYYGGMREDVANQQRFFINANNVENEITISPFLTVGTVLTDSSIFLNAFRTYLDIYVEPNYDTLIITQVDSVLEANGSYSATYHLECLPQSNVSFEFNTYSGLLNIHGFEFSEDQICYREDGEQTLPGQETTWTIMCDLGMDENDWSQLALFPNPSLEDINLLGDLSKITDLTIYDLQGMTVKQVPLSDVNTGISLKELQSGVYLLSFNGGKKVLRFQKM